MKWPGILRGIWQVAFELVFPPLSILSAPLLQRMFGAPESIWQLSRSHQWWLHPIFRRSNWWLFMCSWLPYLRLVNVTKSLHIVFRFVVSEFQDLPVAFFELGTWRLLSSAFQWFVHPFKGCKRTDSGSSLTFEPLKNKGCRYSGWCTGGAKDC